MITTVPFARPATVPESVSGMLQSLAQNQRVTTVMPNVPGSPKKVSFQSRCWPASAGGDGFPLGSSPLFFITTSPMSPGDGRSTVPASGLFRVFYLFSTSLGRPGDKVILLTFQDRRKERIRAHRCAYRREHARLPALARSIFHASGSLEASAGRSVGGTRANRGRP